MPYVHVLDPFLAVLRHPRKHTFVTNRRFMWVYTAPPGKVTSRPRVTFCDRLVYRWM